MTNSPEKKSSGEGIVNKMIDKKESKEHDLRSSGYYKSTLKM